MWSSNRMLATNLHTLGGKTNQAGQKRPSVDSSRTTLWYATTRQGARWDRSIIGRSGFSHPSNFLDIFILYLTCIVFHTLGKLWDISRNQPPLTLSHSNLKMTDQIYQGVVSVSLLRFHSPEFQKFKQSRTSSFWQLISSKVPQENDLYLFLASVFTCKQGLYEKVSWIRLNVI